MTITVDAETEDFARRLARIRGETVEQAVSAAVRAELARVERFTSITLTPEQAALVERTMAMVAKLPRMEIDSDDPTGFLYDEHGLPR
jgi:hypothetical protein